MGPHGKCCKYNQFLKESDSGLYTCEDCISMCHQCYGDKDDCIACENGYRFLPGSGPRPCYDLWNEGIKCMNGMNLNKEKDLCEFDNVEVDPCIAAGVLLDKNKLN